MNTDDMALRMLVEKWLAPTPMSPVRVTRFNRSSPNRRRCICVEASRPTGLLAIFFFRHGDGAWRVFPPSVESTRPMMAARLS
jgi:hypothetical protein